MKRKLTRLFLVTGTIAALSLLGTGCSSVNNTYLVKHIEPISGTEQAEEIELEIVNETEVETSVEEVHTEMDTYELSKIESNLETEAESAVQENDLEDSILIKTIDYGTASKYLLNKEGQPSAGIALGKKEVSFYIYGNTSDNYITVEVNESNNFVIKGMSLAGKDYGSDYELITTEDNEALGLFEFVTDEVYSQLITDVSDGIYEVTHTEESDSSTWYTRPLGDDELTSTFVDLGNGTGIHLITSSDSQQVIESLVIEGGLLESE